MAEILLLPQGVRNARFPHFPHTSGSAPVRHKDAVRDFASSP